MRWAAALFLAAALLSPPAAAKEPTAAPGSVVFLMVDTLRADYLGCYGFQGDISPQIDRLCREAVVFEDALSQAPWTKPSIATLFSSLDPVAHQVLTQRGQYAKPDVEISAKGKRTTDVLPGSVTTIAEAFAEAGYTTAAFVANPWIRDEVGFGQGFQTYEDNFAANGTAADVLIDAGLAWLKHQPKGKPFFLYLHFMDVHDPYDAPDADYEAIKDSPSLGTDRKLPAGKLSKGLVRSLRPVGARWADPDRPERLQLRTWRGRYGAGVRAFDRRLEVLLAHLRDSGLDRKTAIVLTSDHGEELYEHGGWAHGLNLFDHQLHVPLIVRPAGGLEQSVRVKGLIGLIDVAPSLLGHLQITAPKTWRGRNFAKAFGGGTKKVEQPAVFATGVKWQPQLFSARTDRFKLLRERSSGKEKLFDLGKDPAEQRDVRGKNEAAAVRLRGLLDEHLKKAKSGKVKRPATVEIDKATTERLRALGYIE
ncbi:MAG TPA: sulfatase [Terriglobales bacterium]|nr:sulfatase [Terriglobales bacterium]